MAVALVLAAIQIATLHASRSTLHASRFTLHASHFTLHSSRFTLHSSRSTLPCLQFAKIKVFIVKYGKAKKKFVFY